MIGLGVVERRLAVNTGVNVSYLDDSELSVANYFN